MKISQPPENAFLLKTDDSQWLLFENPVQIVKATTTDQILPALEEVLVKTYQGFHAAGFLSYECAPAFDNALACYPPQIDQLPLLWFGIYPTPTQRTNALTESPKGSRHKRLQWLPSNTFEDYHKKISTIKDHIASGNTYQVNYTERLKSIGILPQDSWDFFINKVFPTNSLFSAYWCSGSFALASASPELFFQKTGQDLLCRPMKGTRPRGLYPQADERERQALSLSTKDKAENIMIVDMIRNDLGRIACNNSVITKALFDLEKYSTVWQMTSTVTSSTTANILEIFKALFPCSSITGAPKVQTMKIIKEIEDEPRGIYTGCIGYITPSHDARFSVAIRTATFNKDTQEATYGVGGGVVWDSTPEDEFEECKAKSKILTEYSPTFDLVETLLFEPETGIFLLNQHLKRLQNSANYFDRPCNLEKIAEKLQRFHRTTPQRLRIQLSVDGTFFLENFPLEKRSFPSTKPWTIQLGTTPIQSNNTFLYHKTTYREVYERAKKATSTDEVILFNERGEITEATIANIVIVTDSKYWTPPLSSGLLAGTYRQELLEKGIIQERVITIEEITTAEEIWLINSVRKWIPTILVNN